VRTEILQIWFCFRGLRVKFHLYIIGDLNTQVPPIVVDTEKLKWKANF